MIRIPRVYVDTSVFGGVFDQEFAKESKRFFDRVNRGDFELVVSGVVRREILGAPTEVQKYFTDIIRQADVASITDEALQLMRAYLGAEVVSARWSDDALHVAMATVSGCSFIVSWNFKHIVHYRRIPKYNAINALRGFPAIAIHSPMEMMSDEEE